MFATYVIVHKLLENIDKVLDLLWKQNWLSCIRCAMSCKALLRTKFFSLCSFFGGFYIKDYKVRDWFGLEMICSKIAKHLIYFIVTAVQVYFRTSCFDVLTAEFMNHQLKHTLIVVELFFISRVSDHL